MRTTVTLDEDVARAIEDLRREQGLSTSAAVNTLARRALALPPAAIHRFTQSTSSMGVPRIPLDDISGALDALEGEQRRG